DTSDIASSAHWGQESHLIAIRHRRAPFGKSLIDRSDHRTAKLCKLGKFLSILREHILNLRAFAYFGGIFRLPHDIFQLAKEEDADAHIAILSAPAFLFPLVSFRMVLEATADTLVWPFATFGLFGFRRRQCLTCQTVTG